MRKTIGLSGSQQISLDLQRAVLRLIHTYYAVPLPCRVALIHVCRAVLLPSSQQCRVLRESPRVSGKTRTANREIPRGSRKKPNLGRLLIVRRETADVNLHAPCRAMPWPWEVAYKAAWSEHGMVYVN